MMPAATHNATPIQLCRRRLKLLKDKVQSDPDTHLPEKERQEMRDLMRTLNTELAEATRYLIAAQPPKRIRLSTVGTTHGELSQQALAKVLRELFEENNPIAMNACERGFTLIEVAPQSALDMLGADMLIVNRKGNFAMIDATANLEKINGEQRRELPELRRQGVVDLWEFTLHVGQLGLHEAEELFKGKMRKQLPNLLKSAAASPLNLLDLRLPVLHVGNLWDQMTSRDDCLRRFFALETARHAFLTFVSDLERLATETSGTEAAQLKSFATHLKRARSSRSGKSGPIHAVDEALRRVRATLAVLAERRQNRPRRS